MAWAALIWCIVAANRGFYPWFQPLHQAGVLPANGRGPALITWRRLLANEPEEDATAEAYRVAARRCLISDRFVRQPPWKAERSGRLGGCHTPVQLARTTPGSGRPTASCLVSRRLRRSWV